MPIMADMPTIVQDAHNSFIWFSGAVRLGFGDGYDLFLTWKNDRDCFLFGNRALTTWHRFSLAEIPLSYESPFADLLGYRLHRVELYAYTDDGTSAARHVFVRNENQRECWIGVGDGSELGEGDDLLLSLEKHPSASVLKIAGTIQ